MGRPDLHRQFTKYTAFRINTSEKVYYALAILGTPFMIMQLVFCCWYSIIWARVNQYTTDDWEYALLAPMDGTGFNEKNEMNHLTMSFASFAGKVFVFYLLAFKATMLGVKDPELLPYSTFASIMALIGMTVFRDATPVQPTPKELTASLPSIMRFVQPDMYASQKKNNMYDGSIDLDIGHKAYLFNRFFVLNNLVLVGIVLALMTLSIWGLFTTKAQVWANPRKLRGNMSSLIIALIAFAGYLMTIYAKEQSAQSTLTLMEEANNSTTKMLFANKNWLVIFPFTNSKMDPVSVTMMLAFGSIGIGTCKAHLQNFKLAAVAAFINIAISYPTMIATWLGYVRAARKVDGIVKYYYLWSMNETMTRKTLSGDSTNFFSCTQYVMDSEGTEVLFIDKTTGEQYPWSEGVATGICEAVRFSFIGQAIIFVALHLLLIVCAIMVIKNQDVAAQMTMRRYESFFDHGEDQDEYKNGGGLLGMSKGGDTLLISHNGIVTINPGLGPVTTPRSARNFYGNDDVEEPLISGHKE